MKRMRRRTFLEIALVLGAGLAAGERADLRWSEAEGLPGLRVRLDGLARLAGEPGARLRIVDSCEGGVRVLLDRPLAEVGDEWRIPALRDRLPAPSKAEGVDALHELEARVVTTDERVLARTDTPLTVRFRAHRFSV